MQKNSSRFEVNFYVKIKRILGFNYMLGNQNGQVYFRDIHRLLNEQ